ncbi:tRNA (adenosine(37)-N6)-threonylcarbamoyltransferase complex dimerization subunit type 1 TsaB [Streptococcus equi subsp. equi]|uniref:tRNA (adenosine(37)-N6)-threonylcarbamoyltransferase complex dimerization subunit type 1 TsaB n=1 Tax=Streptococcus equi TaxID=1336 RepID=UPI00294B719B|nr:tRNA (adenosine(37)-N6)-threonylcarbamoyltransferase complex dimerization subunit type 1 TsaB [Streptococcus equi]WOK51628.1 tRNA (adenosine(37)-N6)-threonylcarbamoyltransferase complex dimerization subunit type 1 TsaB [Streptococcus equi subsp. equi]
MKTLAFDTSNKALSVALLDDGTLLADLTINVKKNHSISLMPAIDFLMSSADLKPKDLDRIVVAEGPGSYTGLRVATATTKMLAYSLSIDLVGVSSLYALAASTCRENPDSLVVPLIDARRRHVYVGYYHHQKAVKQDKYASFDAVLAELVSCDHVIFVGEVEGFAEDIRSALPEAKIKPSLPSAFEVGLLGSSLSADNVAAFVPQYLKRVEAEENWLKTHAAGDDSQYVKRV